MSILTRTGKAARDAQLALPSAPREGGWSSLEQTRLDRLTSPTRLYYDTWCRWVKRLRDSETYPTVELMARQEQLSRELLTLGRLRVQPGTGMSGADWTLIADQHDKLQAQQQAILETLEARARGGLISPLTSTPPTTTLDPAPDPFELE